MYKVQKPNNSVSYIIVKPFQIHVRNVVNITKTKFCSQNVEKNVVYSNVQKL